MKIIYDSLLKKRAIAEINRLGDGICEIIIDIDLSFGTINTIEYDKEYNSIFIHILEIFDYDICCDFDELNLEDRVEIIKVLKTI